MTGRMRKCLRLWLLLCVFILSMGAVVSSEVQAAEKGQDGVVIEYYGYNTCAACSPEDAFYEIVREQIGDLQREYPYTIFEYNTFYQTNQKRLSEKREALSIPDNQGIWPIVVLEDRCLIGLEEVREQLREVFLQSVSPDPALHGEASDTSGEAEDASKTKEMTEESRKAEQETQESRKAEQETQESRKAELETQQRQEPEQETQKSQDSEQEMQNRQEPEQETHKSGEAASEQGPEELLLQFLQACDADDTVVLYFSTLACKDCARVKAVLEQLGKEIRLQDGRVSQVQVYELSIAEEQNVPFLWKLFDQYQVPQEQQLVPVLFFAEGYLAGAPEIEEKLQTMLSNGELTGFTADQLQGSSDQAVPVSGKLALAATGFVNGLNPCGISMLLMLLAAAIMMDGGVRKIGLVYLCGKYIAYFCMGFGLYQVFLTLDQGLLSSVSTLLNRIFAVVFAVLAVMYLIDFWNVRKKEYGKVRMQLPSALRKWNHSQIEKLTSVSKSKLLIAVLLLGIVISAGEFFCTGQVYLAAIMYLMKENTGNADTILSFVIYITAMCVPSLILVEVIERTRSVIRASNQSLAWMPAVKLLTAMIFLIAAVVMLFL